MRELGAIVRNQAPSGRASVLDAYGEVLLRGWRAAAGACLFEVEALIQVATACLTVVRASVSGCPFSRRVRATECPYRLVGPHTLNMHSPLMLDMEIDMHAVTCYT